MVRPLTYGIALEEHGEDAVLGKIGVEPSGDAFNAISLRPQTGAPLNPLINAGAIAACGMISGATVEQKTARMAIVDVKVLDHFIVAGRSTLSFTERGLL